MNSKLTGSGFGSCAMESVAGGGESLAVLPAAPNVGIATLDEGFRFRAINDVLASTNGLTVEAHIGKTIRQILGPAADEVEPALRRAFGTGESQTMEVTIKLPTRSTLGHWILTYIPVKDADDKISRVRAIVVEVTEKKTLEDFLFNLAGKLLYLKAGMLKQSPRRRKKIQRSRWTNLLERCTGEVIEVLGSLRPSASPSLTNAARVSNSFAPAEPIEAFPVLERLSRRERQVLHLLASNKNNKEVAHGLGISVRTAEAHRRRIMEKLELHSVSELIHLAIRHGIVEA